MVVEEKLQTLLNALEIVSKYVTASTVAKEIQTSLLDQINEVVKELKESK